MLKTGLKLLRTLEDAGYSAYIVGGFVRDQVLGRLSYDIDISTNATPQEVMEVFKDSVMPKVEYGAITLFMNNHRFEITTFRKENKYIDNRKPVEIEYVNDLTEDLIRRDFTINSLCIDSSGRIIDLLGGIIDLESGIIEAIGDANEKFNQDSLRILRAIRFATILNFKLSKRVKEAIHNNKYLVGKLSYIRKRQELDKIFTSRNASYGVRLLLEFGLDKELELGNLENIKLNNDILGVWASLNVSSKYMLNNNEKDMIKKIKSVVKTGINNKSLYKYGLYINQLASYILEIDYPGVVKMYSELPIKSKKDVDIKPMEISKLLNKEPSYYINKILDDIIDKILSGELKNDKEELAKYIINSQFGG